MTKAMPFLQKYDITFLRPPTISVGGSCLSDVLDDDAAVGLHAGGVGGDVVHILQGSVDHMALVSVHGLQSGAAAGLQNLLCLLAGIAAEAVLPLLPVALSIHIDADVTLYIPGDGVVGQMLNGIQSIATTADQVTQIVANQVDLVGVALCLPAVGNSLGVHMLQKTLDEDFNLFFGGTGLGRSVLLGSFDLLFRLLFGLLLSLLFHLLFGLFDLLFCLFNLLFDLLLCLGSFSLYRFSLGGFGLLHRSSSLGLRAGSAAQSGLGLFGNGIGSFVGHLNLCRLGAEAQETGLCLLDHLNGNTVPVQTQLQQKQQREEAAAKAQAAKEYAAKKGEVEAEPEKESLSGIPERPRCKGRAYDPNRYNTEE